MKSFYGIAITLFLAACQPPPAHPNDQPDDQISSFEVFKGDTCCRTDMKGRKQGKWYIFEPGAGIKDTVFYKNGEEVK